MVVIISKRIFLLIHVVFISKTFCTHYDLHNLKACVLKRVQFSEDLKQSDNLDKLFFFNGPNIIQTVTRFRENAISWKSHYWRNYHLDFHFFEECSVTIFTAFEYSTRIKAAANYIHYMRDLQRLSFRFATILVQDFEGNNNLGFPPQTVTLSYTPGQFDSSLRSTMIQIRIQIGGYFVPIVPIIGLKSVSQTSEMCLCTISERFGNASKSR